MVDLGQLQADSACSSLGHLGVLEAWAGQDLNGGSTIQYSPESERATLVDSDTSYLHVSVVLDQGSILPKETHWISFNVMQFSKPMIRNRN